MGSAAAVRAELIARCDAHSQRALGGHGTEAKKVRRAIQRGRDLIAAASDEGDAADWLRVRRVELDALRDELDRLPDDEDGWSLGGLRTVINEVDALLARELAIADTARSPWAKLVGWWRERSGRG